MRAATRRCTFTAPGALFIFLTPVLASAQPALDGPGEPARTLKTGKVVHAVRIVDAPPVIDGRVTDEAWAAAPSATDFVQRDPDNGEAMTEGTRVHVAYDDRYLYVAVISLDSAPDAIATGLGRRDQLPSSDFVSIGFDPRHDHQRAYVFRTNPSSVQMDFALTDDDRMDPDYDAVWEVRADMANGGWAAEFRLPFSQMRFTVSPQAGQVWGFQAQRFILRKGEEGAWVGKPRGERGEVSLYGHLVFDEPLAPPGRLEIVPYILTRSERLTDTDDGSPFAASAGADVRVGLGSATTLSATVNPDFGQVEQDPAVLNLSVFETFFPEKRPFFLEDSRVFVPPYGLFQLFHSRRIGRAPAHIALHDGDDEIDRPDDTTIYGAAKVTGKSGRWTYGGLTAATGREFAVVEAALQRTERLVEPATSYNVVRLQRDVFGGTSNVGTIATGVLRPGVDDAFTGGFDYNLRWDQNRNYWNGHWVMTRAPGETGLKTGGGGVMNFGVGRKHWNMWSHYDHFSRDFRVSDLGFFRTRANRNSLDGGLNLEQPDPGSRLRNYGVNICAVNGWNDDRLLIDRAICANTWVTFLNFWRVQTGVTRRFDVWDDVDTRGGPPIADPAATVYYFFGNSDSRKSWRLNFGSTGQRGTAGDRELAWNASLSVQPSSRLQLSFSTRFERGTAVAQWIENSDTDGDGNDDHVYGTLDRNVVDITLRGTYSLHRDLTFQAYLQPFVAAGDYNDIRRLARPRSFDFEPVAIGDDPDFNTKSMRGNMVLRWEYVRGSALFVVWDLSQRDETRPGTFSAFRDLRDAFGAGANHILMIKTTYWLNR